MLQPVGDAVLPEIGYHLVRREWGRGLRDRGGRYGAGLGLRRNRLRACLLDVSPTNEPSRRVAARIHRRLETFSWLRTGTEMCLYSTTRDQLAEPTLAERDADKRPPLPT